MFEFSASHPSTRRVAVWLVFITLGWLTPSSAAQPPALPNSTAIHLIGPAILALNLNQQNTTHWFPYTSLDSPEGGYMGWMFAGESSLSAVIRLPRSLPPGRYSVFVKGINYDDRVSITVSGGGGEVSVPTDDRDWNRYWSGAGQLDVRTTATEVRLTLQKLASVGKDTKFLLRGLYLTDRANVVVLPTDSVVDLSYPRQMDDSVAELGNVVENGSFEVGLGHGWGLSSNRTIALNTIWDSATGYHGRASVKLPLDASARAGGTTIDLLSRVYTLKPNKRYTLSMWVKTNGPAPVAGDLRILNTFTPPPGYPPRHELAQHFTATMAWQRVSVTGYLLKYPTSDYQILISGQGTPGQFLWVDAVQLEEGAPFGVIYQPKTPLEIGLVTGQPGNIFYDDEPVTPAVLVYNNGSRPADATIRYEIYDYLNRLVKQGSQTVSVGATTTQQTRLDLAAGQRGFFRVVLWVVGEENSREEVNYAVTPRPQREGPDATSSIGIHSMFEQFQFDALKKLGIKWTRAMSPAALFRWSTVEPVKGQYVWYDDEVQVAVASGFTILGTIGSNNYWPAWADNNGLPKLDEWSAFVTRLAQHYKPYVHTWEIWNEAYAAFPASRQQAGFYAQLLKQAVDAIEAVDPTAQIIALGGSPLDYTQAVITELETRYPNWRWQDHIDGLATHLYPGGESSAADFQQAIISRYHRPVWNTETGVWDQGFYLGPNSNFVVWGESLLPPTDEARYYEASPTSIDLLTQNFLQTMGAGLSKYFYYDSRIAAAPDYLRSHPTILEYDDSIRPKSIAYAVLAQLFDHAEGMGKLSLADPNTAAYLFRRENRSIIALWTTDKSDKWLTVTLPRVPYTVYDVMGNPLTVTDSRIPYGRTPVYIEEQPRPPSYRYFVNLAFAIQTGAITPRPDVLPPNLAFASVTTQASPNTPLRFRWLAIDATSSPTVLTPDTLLYSYQLVGPSGAGAWSDWTPDTYVDYQALPAGAYVFRVRAKDMAGNVSNSIEHTIQVSQRR